MNDIQTRIKILNEETKQIENKFKSIHNLLTGEKRIFNLSVIEREREREREQKNKPPTVS